MITIRNIQVYNIESALRGMRNPMNSWALGDSFEELAISSDLLQEAGAPMEFFDIDPFVCNYKRIVIGEKDIKLAQKLIKAGSEHSKFMRQIFVSMDIEAPLYWWKEMDTYKVSTVANSCSTMHKITSAPITRDCFSFDKELENFDNDLKQYIDEEGSYLTYSETVIRNCEYLRQKYLETQDVRYWRALIQLLPSSWNQKRTWTANYAVLRNIYHQRKNHKLIEWDVFCNIISGLPYGKELITL